MAETNYGYDAVFIVAGRIVGSPFRHSDYYDIGELPQTEDELDTVLDCWSEDDTVLE